MEKYDENAVVQKDLAKKLVQKTLKVRKNFDTILELGSGTGLLTREISQNLTFKRYFANDIVKKSKNYVKKIIPDAEFIHGNAAKINSPKVDLIISNAMFQWLNRLDETLFYYKKFLKPDGILAFSTFGNRNFKEIKEISGLSLNYLSKEELVGVVNSHYKVIYADEYVERLTFDNPLKLLLHMKNTGVNSIADKPWTIKEVKDFCENTLNNTLTYNPIIIVAVV